MAKRPGSGTGVSAVDVAAVDAAFIVAAARACPGNLPLVLSIRERIEPERWALEWQLAEWVGSAFGADPATRFELTVGNILGLASIRLSDDLADGAVAAEDRAAAPVVARALRGAALDFYRRTFAADSLLWPRTDGWLTQTGAGSLDAAGPAAPAVMGSRREAALLAQRGAALKIPAFALALLTGRTAVFPALEECLERAVAAMVLYDHFTDWQEDLVAGRWNVFVAHLSPRAPGVAQPGRPGVVSALLAGDLTASYFERCADHLAVAVEAARTAHVHALADHLLGLARQIDDHGHAVERHYAAVARQATALFMGMAPTRSGAAA